METLIERWRRIAKGAKQIIGPGPLQARPCDALALGLNTAAKELESAGAPRTPMPEWFGDPDKEPGKWDAWAFQWQNLKWDLLSGPQSGACVEAGMVRQCFPVARFDCPVPVGWGVVGGEKRKGDEA